MINHLSFASQYVPRPRLNALLDQASRHKLVYVVAGAGYGKTQAVRQYIEQQQDAVVRWMQLTEGDNIGSRFWESLTHTISIDNPDLASNMRELGFPETPARFKQFAEIVRNREHRANKSFLILDDSHLIHSEETLTFIERGSKLNIPESCVIILSRKEPDAAAASQIMKGKAGLITEDDLRFTATEAGEFFKQQNALISAQNIATLVEATKGWALAINLFFFMLKRTPDNFEYALRAMRQNIFALLESEAWIDFPQSAQKILVNVSLLSDLPIIPLHEIFDNADTLLKVPGLESFLWPQNFTNDIHIHPLYLEFLQSKLHVISEKEQKQTFKRAAQWCLTHGFHINAMYYYAKSQQYDRMIQAFFSYPLKLPRSTSEYFLDILEQLEPVHDEQSNAGIIFLKSYFIPLLLIGIGRYDEARRCALAVVREWEQVDSPFAITLLYATYSNLAYIDMYTCTVTHRYDSAEYLKKSFEYLKRSPTPPAKAAGPFISADIRSFACLVGEGAGIAELDQFLEAAQQTATLIAETPHNIYAGYADLVACEYAFFKNEMDLARRHAHIATLQAREKKQHGIEAMAVNYLLRIAMQEGNATLTKELLKQLESLLDISDFWNRQLYHDLFVGVFYAQAGFPERIPQWLISDEADTTSSIRIPMRELHLNALFYIGTQNYAEAFAVLCRSYPREPQERLLFGEIRLLLLTAVARFHMGDTQEAMKDFERAYEMSFAGMFEFFFIELGKELHPLVAAALKHADCSIPTEWLKMVSRKASAYTKKLAVITAAFQEKKSEADSISLSKREREALLDIYHGLSREEIAEYRGLSINTVKKTLQSAYIKLGAYNNVDAIRIALEKKLIP